MKCEYYIIKQVNRAGDKSNRLKNKMKWDLLYGENKWEIIYKYKDKIYTREEALDEFYNKSHYIYMKDNESLLNELCNVANDIYNPHSINTGSVDLQCPAVKLSLQKLNRKLTGNSKIAIGVWGEKYGMQYPKISHELSPYEVPLWCDKNISVEYFWQNFKYLAQKIYH